MPLVPLSQTMTMSPPLVAKGRPLPVSSRQINGEVAATPVSL